MFAASFTGENVFSLIVYLAIFVGILLLTYYITRWIAGNQKLQASGKNFEVIETTKVSNGKYLQIVRIGKEDYFIISIGKDEIHLIGKLSKEQVIFTGSDTKGTGFKDIFASFQKLDNSEDEGKESSTKGKV